MNIKTIVQTLVNKYKTNDPFEICDYKNIIVSKEPLGTIKGYYSKFYRQKIIHINSELDYHQRLITCAHELGHAIIHPNSNTPFLKGNTFLLVDKLEIEANKFACYLIFSDEEFLNLKDYTIYEIAQILGIEVSLVEYRLKRIYKK